METIVVALAVILWLGLRQTAWTPVNPSGTLRMPLILTAAGAILLFTGQQEEQLTATGLGMLVIELVVGAAVGAAIGLIAHLRPITNQAPAAHVVGRHPERETPAFEARNGIWGLLLWLAMIAGRLGFMFWIGSTGVAIVSAPAAIILLLGVNRLSRSAVVLIRAGREPRTAAA